MQNQTNTVKKTDIEQNTLFEFNMRCCERFRPALYAKLLKLSETERFSLIEECGPSLVNNLYDHKHEALYYEMADPIGSIAEHTESCLNRVQGIILCLGFGLGYGPVMLAQQTNYVSRSIIILEPDGEVLLKAFKSIDCTSVLSCKDVLLLVSTPTEEVGAAVFGHITHEQRLINSKNFQIVDLPASYKANASYYLKGTEATKNAIIQGVKCIGNCTDDCLLGLDAALANLPHHATLPPVRNLDGLFPRKPAIIVSSGPSLDKNLDLLEHIGNRAVIIAADASLRMMRKKGLKPHFVTSVERVEETAILFEGLDEEDFDDVYLVGSPICHPRTFELFKGPQISTEREHGFFELLSLDKGKLVPGPSAGNMAFRLAQKMGCDPIILIGQDLAVSDDGRTHANNNKYGDKIEGYLTDPITLPGNYQDSVRSNPILRMFHQAYEYDVSVATQRIINCTEGGARITGTEVMELAEALRECIPTQDDSDQNIVTTTQSALKVPTREESGSITAISIANLEAARNYLESTYAVIDEAKEAASQLALLRVDPDSSDSLTQVEELHERIGRLSSLTKDPNFARIARDMVQPVFFHTMADYVHALANAKDDSQLTDELVKNTENLANNFSVILRYVDELIRGHLEAYKRVN